MGKHDLDLGCDCGPNPVAVCAHNRGQDSPIQTDRLAKIGS